MFSVTEKGSDLRAMSLLEKHVSTIGEVVFDRVNFLRNLGNIFKLKEIFFKERKEGQREPVNCRPSISDKVIKNWQSDIQRQVASKESHNPLTCQHFQIELQAGKVVVQARKPLFD